MTCRRPPRRAVDLPDRTHVVSDVDDTARQPACLDIAHFTRRAEGFRPCVSFATQFLAQIVPLGVRYHVLPPTRRPVHILYGRQSSRRPPIEQRHAIAQVIDVGGD